MGASREAFRDRPRAAGRRIANLFGVLHIPLHYRPIRHTIDFPLEIVRELPALKFREMTRSGHVGA